MSEFAIFLFDADGEAVGARIFLARDDLDALEEAERACSRNAVEIWQGRRRVARVKEGNRPLLITDRTCL